MVGVGESLVQSEEDHDKAGRLETLALRLFIFSIVRESMALSSVSKNGTLLSMPAMNVCLS